MSDYHINVFWSEDDGCYVADIPDLEACSAFGATPVEALEEAIKAKDAWLAVARERGDPHPPTSIPPRDLPGIPLAIARLAQTVNIQRCTL